ncbi:hypothetical protein QQ045_007695 [Rhodiola kirilowii]
MGGQRVTKVEMDAENDTKNDESAASPTSVLKDERLVPQFVRQLFGASATIYIISCDTMANSTYSLV